MNPRIENRKTTSHVVRVITTYRIDSESLVDAKEKMNSYLVERELPKNIRMIGKAEVLTLRGLL